MSTQQVIAETLGRKFAPPSFPSWAPEDSLFREPIGHRGWLTTFASQFPATGPFDPGLVRDVEMLSNRDLGQCYSGASDFPILPFFCELEGGRRPLRAVDVLARLNVRDFRSDHIPSLDATWIPYPGYHPGPANDEIHNDFDEQYIFDNEEAGASDGFHGELMSYVAGGQLWYVLLHPRAIAWRKQNADRNLGRFERTI